jgi:hypothetical protein
MPSSRACTIPFVVDAIKQLQPTSILDVGVGFGKWGMLFREYTDVLASEEDPDRYHKRDWKVRIEGIEGHRPYLHAGHDFIYDRIHVGDVHDQLAASGAFDVIFFGDIIEHLELQQGKAVLRTALENARQCVILTTPRTETHQGAACAEGAHEVADCMVCSNPLERHRSLWSADDFQDVGACQLSLADPRTYVVAWSTRDAPDFTLASGEPSPGGWFSSLLEPLRGRS